MALEKESSVDLSSNGVVFILVQKEFQLKLTAVSIQANGVETEDDDLELASRAHQDTPYFAPNQGWVSYFTVFA
jgi:hypothetical protein